MNTTLWVWFGILIESIPPVYFNKKNETYYFSTTLIDGSMYLIHVFFQSVDLLIKDSLLTADLLP